LDFSGLQFDIHTGIMNLKYPHHANEIAQAEACFNSNSCANYFLHIGNLIVDEKKSTPIKNILEMNLLEIENFRIFLLMNNWTGSLVYNEEEQNKTSAYLNPIKEFFMNINQILKIMEMGNLYDPYSKMDEKDFYLFNHFRYIKEKIRIALCNSIDTPQVMEYIRTLVITTNKYMDKEDETLNLALLQNIFGYITRIIKIFGLNFSANNFIKLTQSNEQETSIGSEEEEGADMNLIKPVDSLRHSVRTKEIAINNEQMLTSGDRAKDNILTDFNVQLEDQGMS
jgi:cysteinyl-tRNA synthetase